MKAAISSLNFSPGHFSHIMAYAKLFEELGYSVTLWLHKDYEKIVQDNEFRMVWYPNAFPESADVIFFANISTVNHKISRDFRKNGSKIIYLYHEPWESFGQYLKEGLKQALKATAAHFFSIKTLKYSDLVIVPSNYAFNLYKKKDIKYSKSKKVVMIPLVFDDEVKGNIDIQKKEYFSYIGHAVEGHAFDVYVDLIKHIYQKGIKMKFEIATKTDIGKLLNRDEILQEMIKDGTLEIIHGRPLTNQEINRAYERSFCVWNMYRRSTQSGVLPKAYMFGTPVIAKPIGSFPEFVVEGETGFLIGDYDFEVVLKRIFDIQNRLDDISIKCREKFKRTFYWKAHVYRLQELLRNENQLLIHRNCRRE